MLQKWIRCSAILILSVGMVISLSAQSSFDEALQTLLEETISADEPGIVLLVSTEDGEATAAYGSANLEDGTPIQADDQFRIGSITKTFIGVLMLQLQEEDYLSLDDTLADWLDEDIISQIPNGDEVTLRQLLNMTSGIPDYLATDAFFDAIDADPSYAWTAAETIEFIYGDAPLFAPGEGFEYSNTNYNLLQLVIEEAAEAPLAEALDEFIFAPVGMESTYLEDSGNLGANIVQGYAPDGDEYINITMVNDGAGMADGGIISTADDMLLFAQALINGDLISEDSMQEMMTTTPESDDEYGLGLDVIEGPDGGQIIGHSGSTGGFQSIMYSDLEYGVTVIGLTNNFDADYMSFDLADTAIELALESE